MQNTREIRGSKWSQAVYFERILVEIARVWARSSQNRASSSAELTKKDHFGSILRHFARTATERLNDVPRGLGHELEFAVDGDELPAFVDPHLRFLDAEGVDARRDLRAACRPARMSASACLKTSGEGGLPLALRMLAARSFGPTKTASMPGTE